MPRKSVRCTQTRNSGIRHFWTRTAIFEENCHFGTINRHFGTRNHHFGKRNRHFGTRTAILGRESAILGRETAISGRETTILGREIAILGRELPFWEEKPPFLDENCHSGMRIRHFGTRNHHFGEEKPPFWDKKLQFLEETPIFWQRLGYSAASWRGLLNRMFGSALWSWKQSTIADWLSACPSGHRGLFTTSYHCNWGVVPDKRMGLSSDQYLGMSQAHSDIFKYVPFKIMNQMNCFWLWYSIYIYRALVSTGFLTEVMLHLI